MSNKHSSEPVQQGSNEAQPSGSVETEHNKANSSGQLTQTNEPRRTPKSRSDRVNHVGGANQMQARKGGR